MFKVVIEGFKSKDTAKAFAEWYVSWGEDEFNRPDACLPDGVYIGADGFKSISENENSVMIQVKESNENSEEEYADFFKTRKEENT